ncbi:MAG TPA: ChbG/HpnK family deacetylase [Bacteroidota bacterium]
MTPFRTLFVLVVMLVSILSVNGQGQTSHDTAFYLVRCDDMGMSHSVNMAIEEVLDSGLPISVSMMFACPWYQEAVEILRKHPETSVGVHLTLNAEWRNYRWGPVSGRTVVPSLVDSLGYFFPTRAALFANNPRVSEVETELRAQIERALNTGITIDYLDYHMSAAMQTLELRELVERLAHEYRLGIAQYFGEHYSNITYGAPIESKSDSLIGRVSQLRTGINLQVVHVGLDTPELRAMRDLNTFGPSEMSKNREGELRSLLSDGFRKALRDNNVHVITYRDLIRRVGLKNMLRPANVK